MWRIQLQNLEARDEGVSIDFRAGEAIWISAPPSEVKSALGTLRGEPPYPLLAHYAQAGTPIAAEAFARQSRLLPLLSLPTDLHSETFHFVWGWLTAVYRLDTAQTKAATAILHRRGVTEHSRLAWSATPERLRATALALAAGAQAPVWIAASGGALGSDVSLRGILPAWQETARELGRALIWCGPRLPRGLQWRRVNWPSVPGAKEEWNLWGEPDAA